MAEDSDQEKTEQASARKQQQAREKGQVPRSRELSAFLVTVSGCVSIILFSNSLINTLLEVAEKSFRPGRDILTDPALVAKTFTDLFYICFIHLLPILSILFIMAILSPIFMGGWNLSTQALAPQLGRLNPLKGLKKMFSVQSLVEMLKALGKFVVIALIAVLVLKWQIPELFGLGQEAVHSAIAHSISMVGWSFLWVASGLVIITMVDVPFQLWNHAKQLRMTKQEVKEEFKDTEGKPEVKGRIRRMQREIAQRRMMEKVPQADVVITNPTHYAVALRYKMNQDRAPVVLAKGKDLVALKIKEVAKNNNIVQLEAPPLARAIFFTTKLDQEIPAGLYMAVAQALAYVHQLERYQKGRGPRPAKAPDFPIPAELRRDE